MAEMTDEKATERNARKSRTGIVVSDKMQKTAYEIMRSDWSSDVCSSDL